MVRNHADAEDLVYDCYGKLLAKADMYDLANDGDKLLYKAVTNACINFVQRRPPVVSLDCPPIDTDDTSSSMADHRQPQPHEQAAERELADSLAEALASLPIKQRAAVELRSLGHSLVEIADVLGVSHANARVLLFRARESLAVRLRPYIEENVQ